MSNVTEYKLMKLHTDGITECGVYSLLSILSAENTPSVGDRTKHYVV